MTHRAADGYWLHPLAEVSLRLETDATSMGQWHTGGDMVRPVLKVLRPMSLWQRFTLQYVVITVGAILVLDLCGRTVDWLVLRRTFAASQLAEVVQWTADQLSATDLRTLSSEAVAARLGGVFARLQDASTRVYGVFELESAPEGALFVYLLDEAARMRMTVPVGVAPPGADVGQVFDAADAALVTAALRQSAVDVAARGDGHSLAVAPVTFGGRTTGALAIRTALPTLSQRLWRDSLASLASNAGGATVVFGMIGLGFGVWSAVRLTRRLRGIAAAADAWSRGEFSTRADDSSPDEVGQLARRLNAMSDDLQDVLRVRQALAAVDERHRLARDLHDSVKQQVFALGLQVAAAQHTAVARPHDARAKLDEAGRLVASVQEELVGLIRQLRPAEAAPSAVGPRLRAQIQTWSRQHDVDARVEGDVPFVSAEHADVITRIVQEALANVARHSGAASVVVSLTVEGPASVVRIVDDGRGFDPAAGQGDGMRNMRERASMLPGGQLEVRRGCRIGTVVRLQWVSSNAGGRVVA